MWHVRRFSGGGEYVGGLRGFERCPRPLNRSTVNQINHEGSGRDSLVIVINNDAEKP
jgi:hypothetical protein